VNAAFEERMYEIEIERASEGNYDSSSLGGENRWDESIRILQMARRQLVGH
jgi:hypothetical protein